MAKMFVSFNITSSWLAYVMQMMFPRNITILYIYGKKFHSTELKYVLHSISLYTRNRMRKRMCWYKMFGWLVATEKNTTFFFLCAVQDSYTIYDGWEAKQKEIGRGKKEDEGKVNIKACIRESYYLSINWLFFFVKVR